MNLNKKFVQLQADLGLRHFERQDEIEIATVALLTGFHTVMVGPPGCDKSGLTQDLCAAIIGGEFYDNILNKYSVPEQLFGPVSMKGLEEDEFRRLIDESLATAHIAFIDEFFKASPALLHTMLGIMNERTFKNGRQNVKVPLLTMFAASNELPEGEELGAVFDRFQFRVIVKYIEDPSNFAKLLTFEPNTELSTITLEELQAAQIEVRQVTIPNHVVNTLDEIRSDLKMAGIVVSDRRFRQSIKVLKAMAFLDGRDHIDDNDFRILQHMFWTNIGEIKPVAKIILSKTNPLELAADNLIDLADDIAKKVVDALMEQKQKGTTNDQLSKKAVEWFTNCKTLIAEVRDLKKKALETNKSTIRIDQANDRVTRVFKETARICGLQT